MKEQNLSQLLLDWYYKNGRDLPWRVKGGAHENPYVVLVSEFMLQQTTVKTVIPYFTKFMERFPTIFDLAQADLEEVYHYWQGLGYYSRARSLKQTAEMIVAHGSFPQTEAEVLKLKGVGEYTAASFLALAFNQPLPVVDGNVMRIICRMYHLTQPLDDIKQDIKEKALKLTSVQNPADYASAIMDLGAMICTPKNPHCDDCPWQKCCASAGTSDVENIPYRKKNEKPVRYGAVYLIKNSEGKYFIQKRMEKGLLSGLYEFPWCDNGVLPIYATAAEDTGQEVVHVFTHFKLVLRLFILDSEFSAGNGLFVFPSAFENYPFSTLMKKVWKKFSSAE